MNQRLRILHLEDEPFDSEIVQQALREEGMACELDRVVLLMDFRNALERGGYGLILADYTVPGTDPLEALHLARQMRPEVPFIFLSGTIGEDTAIETLKLGASDYVLKQRMERLVPALRRACQEAEALDLRHQAEQQLQQVNEQLARANEDLERTVQERTARLRESIAELESFSSTLSHDMRAPLRAIQGFSSMLLKLQGGKLDESGREYLQQITSAACRLETLVEGVLDHSRFSRAPITLHPVNVEQLLEHLIRENPNWQAPKTHIHIERPLHPVLGHKAFLSQCLSNLVNNAVKFVIPGQVPEIQIRTEVLHFATANPENRTATSDGGACAGPAAGSKAVVRLWVEDNGIGVPKDDQQRLFQIFQRVHSDYEGTGLGLSIVRKATERMGGTVGVESEPGKGSRFWMELQPATI